MSEKIKCGCCGRDDVKLYRPYGMFYRPKDNRCNGCLENADWYVPCVQDPVDMTIWGYSAVPPEACERFYNMPDADPTKRGYGPNGWEKDNEVRMRKLTELNK